MQLISQFRELDLICECQNCDDIWKAIEKVKRTEYKSYTSNTQKIIESLISFIEG